ncbi:MAG: acyl-CoA/acyl-ACP dehydrogenase [Deltaproteobacteria bacterium]|nr:acyl-CoA/acyl-ACP dehydrogenase [Deltaproteobacteria bacterium]
MPYFDVNLELTSEDKMIRDAAHKFAAEVMRPIARQIDRMPAQEAVADGSPLWGFVKQGYQLGYHKALFPEAVGGLGFTSLQGHILSEELVWGGLGLAGVLLLASWPYFKLAQTGRQDLIEEFVAPFCACDDGSMTGAWAIIEPDRGSDQLSQGEDYYRDPKITCRVRAVRDGSHWVISGQKAAWVSCGPTATHVMLNVQIDGSRGLAGGGVCFLPLNLDGVSRGKALEKVGQRDLPQGELYFDEVRIPDRWMFVRSEGYADWVTNNLGFGNAAMTLFAIGLARAAFEEALGYAKERVQGGKPLIEHWYTKMRIGRMFGKVEAIRATSRAVWNLNTRIYPPAPEYSFAAKAVCTELARDVIDEAVQVHGANGLTKEYYIEKLWRDSRALTIEDGENDVLCRSAGHLVKELYPRPQGSVNQVG